MDELIEKVKELKESILNSSEVIEYLRLKELIEKDSNLKEMRMNIAQLEHGKKFKEKANLLALYESNPLVHNYELAKKEVEQILLSIKDIIQN